jgi:hypothetical protein
MISRHMKNWSGESRSKRPPVMLRWQVFPSPPGCFHGVAVVGQARQLQTKLQTNGLERVCTR